MNIMLLFLTFFINFCCWAMDSKAPVLPLQLLAAQAYAKFPEKLSVTLAEKAKKNPKPENLPSEVRSFLDVFVRNKESLSDLNKYALLCTDATINHEPKILAQLLNNMKVNPNTVYATNALPPHLKSHVQEMGDHFTLLGLASYCNNSRAIKLLLKHDADPNKSAMSSDPTNQKDTFAFMSPLFIATRKKNYAALQELLNNKEIDINTCCDGSFHTLLLEAIKIKNFPLIQLLLHRGADPNQAGSVCALKKENGTLEKFKWFFGFNDARFATNSTPLTQAIEDDDTILMQLLLKYNADKGLNRNKIVWDKQHKAYKVAFESPLELAKKLDKKAWNLLSAWETRKLLIVGVNSGSTTSGLKTLYDKKPLRSSGLKSLSDIVGVFDTIDTTYLKNEIGNKCS